MSNAPDTIYTNSLVRDDKPFVQLKYGEDEDILDALEGRKVAIALIEAATISTTEGGLIPMLMPPKKKGFGKPSDRDARLFAGILQHLRSARPPLSSEKVQPIFGMKTQEPLVNLTIAEKVISLEPSAARTVGQRLLGAVEAAISDLFLYKLGDELDISRDEMQAISITSFAQHRSTWELESLVD